MGIGSSVFLIAVGLILALAVDASFSGIDIATVGWILVAAGVLGLVLTLVVFAPRRRAVRSETVVRRDEPVVEERRYREDI